MDLKSIAPPTSTSYNSFFISRFEVGCNQSFVTIDENINRDPVGNYQNMLHPDDDQVQVPNVQGGPNVQQADVPDRFYLGSHPFFVQGSPFNTGAPRATRLLVVLELLLGHHQLTPGEDGNDGSGSVIVPTQSNSINMRLRATFYAQDVNGRTRAITVFEAITLYKFFETLEENFYPPTQILV
jgi:hypothetical protein